MGIHADNHIPCGRCHCFIPAICQNLLGIFSHPDSNIIVLMFLRKLLHHIAGIIRRHAVNQNDFCFAFRISLLQEIIQQSRKEFLFIARYHAKGNCFYVHSVTSIRIGIPERNPSSTLMMGCPITL